jgi:hypothetical protein
MFQSLFGLTVILARKEATPQAKSTPQGSILKLTTMSASVSYTMLA